MVEKSYFTPNEAADLLMVATATLRVWSDKGLLKPFTTPGGHRRYLREDLDRFQREHAGQAAASARKSRRILIVDDETAIGRYLSDLLSGFSGVSTAVAHDGFSAGSLLHVFQPEVVLLDLMMPGLDGFQVCRQIKSEPATRDIRVIAMTGYPTSENLENIVAVGAESCLAKPLDEDQLLTMLGLAEPKA